MLRDPQSYKFSYADQELGIMKEVDDEDIRLCDACPFGGLLKLMEIKEDSASIELDEEIGQLIGKCKCKASRKGGSHSVFL